MTGRHENAVVKHSWFIWCRRWYTFSSISV